MSRHDSRPAPRDGLAAAEDAALDMLIANLDQVGAFRGQAESAVAMLAAAGDYMEWAEARMTSSACLLELARGALIASGEPDRCRGQASRELIALIDAELTRLHGPRPEPHHVH